MNLIYYQKWILSFLAKIY